ncbi:MAG: Holliday junction DNA helicase RuvA [Planctomycetaceae bacterium]|jgi:Holliday junction DNA helicase RuvA|nr:Holliday junction DNA helicase RuvA [Planctomycetaceae bacterium]
MITKITGNLVSLSIEYAIFEIGAFEYEVLIPEFTRLHLQPEIKKTVSLHTIEYIEGGQMQSRMTPRLIGFLTEAEREFFEFFCSVDGVGVKKALRAMIHPVREIAVAIEEKDEKWLSSLPGIGAATAERIVAKLRRKVPKFTLMVDRNIPGNTTDTQRDVVSEAYEALIALGHSEAEARKLIDSAHADKKKYKSATELLYAVYQQVGKK